MECKPDDILVDWLRQGAPVIACMHVSQGQTTSSALLCLVTSQANQCARKVGT